MEKIRFHTQSLMNLITIFTLAFIIVFVFYFCSFGACAAFAAETVSKSLTAAGSKCAKGILVICPDTLSDFSYDDSKNELSKIIDIKIKNAADAVKFKNHYILYSGTEIFSFNKEGGIAAQKKYSSIGSITADNDAIYISADGLFICLDEKLNEIGKTDLGIAKNAHDMMIHEKNAYLLDNLLIPMYIFKIDITRAAAPIITEKYLMEGVYSHLFAHCLTDDAKGWIIFQSYGHQLGNGYIINYFDNANIKQGPYYKEYPTSVVVINENASPALCDYSVRAVAGGSRPLAVIAETTGENMFLAEIKLIMDKDGQNNKSASISPGFEYKPGCGFGLDFENLIPLSPTLKKKSTDTNPCNDKTLKIANGTIFHCHDNTGVRLIKYSSGTINETVISYKEPLSSNPVNLIIYQ
jgi:hypothetical protein